MKTFRVLGLAALFGVLLPVMACSNPTAPRLPESEDDEEDDRPDENDDTALLLMLSSEPVMI